jgi:hypothetical protein
MNTTTIEKKLYNYAKKNMIDNQDLLKTYEFIGDDDKSYPAIAEIAVEDSTYLIQQDMYINKHGEVKAALNEWTQEDIKATFFIENKDTLFCRKSVIIGI